METYGQHRKPPAENALVQGFVEGSTQRPVFWTLREVADLLGVSVDTVWRACRAGTIPHLDTGSIFLVPDDFVHRLERGEAL